MTDLNPEPPLTTDEPVVPAPFYPTTGVIAFVPDNAELDPDLGTIGVFVREERRLWYFPWNNNVALHSKSAHILGTPVTRLTADSWRLQDGETGWFDPIVPTPPHPVRLRRVAKTKAALSAPVADDSIDNLEYDLDSDQPEPSTTTTAPSGTITNSPSSTTTVARPKRNASSSSSPQA